jgi:hypothetical protein
MENEKLISLHVVCCAVEQNASSENIAKAYALAVKGSQDQTIKNLALELGQEYQELETFDKKAFQTRLYEFELAHAELLALV